jgi:STAS-like domain of unknown function (DUF4325)
MKTIKVVSLFTTSGLLSSEKGKILLENILKSLDNSGSKVVIDFSGYEYLSSSFLNHSFGELIILKNWSMEDFNSNLEIINLMEDDMEDLNLSVFNAIQRKKMLDKGLNPEDVYNHYMVT